MGITEVPFALLRFQYQIARFPLQLIRAADGCAAHFRRARTVVL